MDRGLVARDSVVRQGLFVEADQRRNSIFRVHRGDGPGLFIKQPVLWRDENLASVRREAALYRAAADSGRDDLPLVGLVGFDEVNCALTLELIATPVEAERPAFEAHLEPAGAEARGRALADLHSWGQESLASLPNEIAQERPPLAFGLLSRAADQVPSHAAGQLVSMAQAAGDLLPRLEAAKDSFESTGLFHGDLRWGNFVFDPLRDRWLVVDWELAGRGDPAWDLAFLLQSYLSFWVMSTPIEPGDDPVRVFAAAESELEPATSACGRLFLSYTSRSGLEPAATESLADRVSSFVPCALYQSAYEHAAARRHISTNIVCLLQLVANLASSPRAATRRLCGL